jgi:hypothetical protein
MRRLSVLLRGLLLLAMLLWPALVPMAEPLAMMQHGAGCDGCDAGQALPPCAMPCPLVAAALLPTPLVALPHRTAHFAMPPIAAAGGLILSPDPDPPRRHLA